MRTLILVLLTLLTVTMITGFAKACFVQQPLVLSVIQK